MARNVHLFSPLTLRGVTFPNRVFMSPMCQYSCVDGVPGDWHFVHLGSRAVGGVGLVMVEATGVSPEGRISPGDTGIWNDIQAEAFARIVKFVREQGPVAGIQLAHAGRKASTAAPWDGGKKLDASEGGWEPVAPSALPFSDDYPMPREMNHADIEKMLTDFEAATKRAISAGFQVIELHMAHGYLLHEFLSPLSNKRTDQYGGSLENRMRLPLELVRRVRSLLSDDLPLFVRISATDWVEGGWDLEQSVEFAKRLKAAGVDLVDCSTGGALPDAVIPAGPGYQIPFAEDIRKRANVPTAAVGFIVQPYQAESVLATGQADAVMLARELLRFPYWAYHAAKDLGAKVQIPRQYQRAGLD
jgi:2,4-dienoyl-CoA reductase-like NADH-dependent reductase (Old Yellow Enzyme family)